MTRGLVRCALGVLLVGAILLAVVFRAHPESEQTAAPSGSARAVSANPAPQTRPPLEEAVRDLERAKRDLEASSGKFNWHRAKAIDYVNQALEECNKALRSVRVIPLRTTAP